MLKAGLALTLLMFPALVAPTSASKIAFSIGREQTLVVMDETGANPTEICHSTSCPGNGGHRFGGGEGITISPPGPDGTWVAFDKVDWDRGAGAGLYQVRADGTGLDKVLCSAGSYIDGSLHGDVMDEQWSPKGTEILVQNSNPTTNSFGLLPAGFAVGSGATGADCASLLLRIYEPQEDGWGIEGHAAWNDDGTKIAFFEYNQDPAVRLVILVRQETGWQPVFIPTDVEHNSCCGPFFNRNLDWQRGGNLLAFSSPMGDREPQWLNWIDATSGDWGYLTEGGIRLEGSSPSWSPDGSQLIFSDDRGNLVKWTYLQTNGNVLEGSTEVMGLGWDPDWQRDPLSITCEFDSDCQDGNPCTDDACDQVSGLCSNPPNFNTCDDGNECTLSDTCDASGLCSGLPASDGDSCSGGGFCCGAQCVVPACMVDVDCDDGDFCTLDACSSWLDPCAASCQYTTNPDPICQCLPKRASCSSDTECCSNKCRGGRCK
jgi:hypothetical protein